MDAAKDYGDSLTVSERKLVEDILALPHKIVQNHHVDGLAQLVLYDISHSGRFGFKKAAYFVDNPDFDCLHGIAGFSDGEFEPEEDVWVSPAKHIGSMNGLAFNKNVKAFRSNSFNRKKIDISDTSQICDLTGELGIEKPHAMGWQLKHGNHGIFVYEPREDVCIWRKSVLASIVALLGLCAL